MIIRIFASILLLCATLSLVAEDIPDTPAQGAIMPVGGLSTFYLEEQWLVNLKFGGEIYVRDWVSVKGAMVVPFQTYDGKAVSETQDGVRRLPVLLQAGGAIHFWSPWVFDFYLPMLAGFEINRNESDDKPAQTFIELGGGGQLFVFGMFALRMEYAYHFSTIPQTNNSYVEHNYHRVETSLGFYF